jgi:hypothetical protein
MLLVAATLVAWHGFLIATPHHHTDASVPREELACSASGPSSQVDHLHTSGRPMAPHTCLACLAGSAPADSVGVARVETLAGGASIVALSPSDLRSRFHTHLPPLRGPPSRS